MKTYLIAFLLISSTWSKFAFAQKDTLTYRLGLYTTYASQAYQPLWLTANRYDLIPDNKGDISLAIATQYTLKLKHFSLESGASLVGNFVAGRYRAQELYGKIKFKHWQMTGGREMNQVGEVDSLLSSGSLAISGNALPIPKVGIRSNGFVPFPFLHKDWLQFKFSWLHGWMGNSGEIEDAKLHEKSLYLKFGNSKYNFYGGITHFALWGGRLPQGPLPNRFQDYVRVIVGAPQKNDLLFSGPQDTLNALGSHLAVLDFGFNFTALHQHWQLYTQSIFDRGANPEIYGRDAIDGFLIFSKDRLTGIQWENVKKNSWLQSILLEYLYTKHQGGPIIYEGRFNYYNNATYIGGWTYHDRIIGTPLFINQEQAIHYLEGENKLSGWNVISNRIQGIHVGLSGSFTTQLRYKALVTYTNHYGNYYNDELFIPSKRQVNTLLELDWKMSPYLMLTGAYGLDKGNLSNTHGFLLKLQLFSYN